MRCGFDSFLSKGKDIKIGAQVVGRFVDTKILRSRWFSRVIREDTKIVKSMGRFDSLGSSIIKSGIPRSVARMERDSKIGSVSRRFGRGGRSLIQKS